MANLSQSEEYTCPACNAVIALRGVRAFVTTQCPKCRAAWRPRTEIGGFHLFEPLARGGFGIIFRAVEIVQGAPLAVKLIRPPSGSIRRDFDQFTADLRSLARLQHPHCLRIFTGGIERDLAWQAMEWLPKGSLADLIATRGSLGESETLVFAKQAASGLTAAHDAGLSHRDLKASDLILTNTGTLKVSGFAEPVFYERAAEELGTFQGRLYSNPPERLRYSREDVRSQIYALGAVLFQALTGRPLYGGETIVESFFDQLEGPALRVERFANGINKATAAFFNCMLAVKPEERFHTWTELLDQLAKVQKVGVRRPRTRKSTGGKHRSI